MSLTAATVKKWLSLSMAAALFAALLISLLMIADALQNSTRFEHLYSTLLLINALALLALLTLIGLNLRNLIHQVKRGRAGARLTVRLVSLLVILATIPVLIVYYFSLEFLHQRLDNWFDVDIERALTQALDLSRAALDAQMREAFKRAQIVADELNNYQQNGDISIKLNELRDSSGASELTLLTAHGRIIASNSADMGQLLPTRPHDNLLLQLERSDSYISLEPASDNRLHIHVIIRLTHQQQLLHALFPLSERISQLANRVEAAFVNYKERAYLHKPLKVSFTLVLSLVLLLSVFGTMWLAFFAARRFVAPLSNLAEGTKAVASGNYEKQLPVTHLDELGFLVHSFNDMTRKIAQARDEVKTSQQLADSQRTYLEAILGRLSSGVIALDYEQRLRMANAAADDILALPMSALLGHTLNQLQDSYPALTPLSRAIYPYLFNNAQDWREEITLFGSSGRKILMCRGTQLQFASLQGQLGGYVIVFDDITTLIQAQRDAAWSEVARRLAHEIKNPLTPIQLSAERLRQKYLPRLSTQEGQTLDRMTHTIIQQVEAMKEMVNTFSNYARSPQMHWQAVDINQLIKDVVELYQQEHSTIQLHLDETLPLIEADRGRLRQSLHNLIKNALEAAPKLSPITVTSHYLAAPALNCVELHIHDQGSGIPEALIEKIFEPYVTTKTKGSGLGLAIVKKIVEEHHGMVWIANQGGACVHIRLPICRPQAETHDSTYSRC